MTEKVYLIIFTAFRKFEGYAFLLVSFPLRLAPELGSEKVRSPRTTAKKQKMTTMSHPRRTVKLKATPHPDRNPNPNHKLKP